MLCQGWEERVARVVRDLGEAVLSGLKLDVEPTNHFVGAFLGRDFRWREQVARRVATLAGQWAPRILRVALESCGWRCTGAAEPFDLRCCGFGSCYRVKVVSGEKAFNSTTIRAVMEAAAGTGSPCIILTVQGYWRGSHEREVGPCRWLDAIATWKWVTGDPRGYRRFLDILYGEAAPYRRRLWERITGVARA